MFKLVFAIYPTTKPYHLVIFVSQFNKHEFLNPNLANRLGFGLDKHQGSLYNTSRSIFTKFQCETACYLSQAYNQDSSIL